MTAPGMRTAIELAWFDRVSIHTLALKYKLKPSGIRSIWRRAKARGRLPKVKRPLGGPMSRPQRDHLKQIARAA